MIERRGCPGEFADLPANRGGDVAGGVIAVHGKQDREPVACSLAHGVTGACDQRGTHDNREQGCLDEPTLSI